MTNHPRTGHRDPTKQTHKGIRYKDERKGEGGGRDAPNGEWFRHLVIRQAPLGSCIKRDLAGKVGLSGRALAGSSYPTMQSQRHQVHEWAAKEVGGVNI